MTGKGNTPNDVLFLAEEFNLAIKLDDFAASDSLKLTLENLNEDSLFQQLDNESKRKAFWLNMYNGYIQYFLKKNEALYQKRGAFFKKKRIVIAGKELSLDDIEHGIIRRSKAKLTLGYTQKWCKSKFEKRFRLEAVDYRIHFALNCGAKSCPPVAFYKWKTIDEQLELATEGYLKNECVYSESENIIHVPKLFSWFRGDFGGMKGTLEILKKFKVIPNGAKPKIKYQDYSWALELNKYSD
jgi:hypothetical protein